MVRIAPAKMRRVQGWLTILWVLMIPVSLAAMVEHTDVVEA